MATVTVREASSSEIVVTAPAEIDMATAPRLASELEQACRQRPTRVAVDFTETTFCDSAAMTVLLDAVQAMKVNGIELEIRPNSFVDRVADLLGFSSDLRRPSHA